MSCPDAVRVGLLNLSGMLEVKYDADQDVFSVRFESVLLPLGDILTNVSETGRQLGRNYFPEVSSRG